MILRERLQRMLQIVEESERAGALADIERDILLTELREAYTELKFGGERNEEIGDGNEEIGGPVVESVAEEPAVAELPVAPIDDDEESDEPEVEVELLFDETEESGEEIEDNSEEIGDRSEEREDNSEEREELSSLASRLSSKNPLLSLYEDNPAPILGEQFHETPSVADTIACPKGVAESAPVTSLREAIGVVDKFMLIRELFGGDGDAYERAIDALEMQPSFDDCIIYIAEHYAWSPNSQAAKLVMELLNRKFN